MKLLFLALLLSLSFSLQAQQVFIDPVKTNIDLRKERYLDSLVTLIGNKRIVTLGEDTHGTAEFYELRAAITKKLIKEKGFNVMILENPHEDMMALQDGLRTEKYTLMRKHLFSIYQTRQMKDFLQWFKKYSKKRKGLRLAGCDDSYREILPEQLIRAIAVYKNPSLDYLANEFFLRQTLEAEDFYAHVATKPHRLPDEMQFGRDTYQLLEKMDSLCGVQPVQYSKIKELIFHAKSAYIFYERFARKLPVSRDEIMGERINYYAADPHAKIIVWAHNGHIAKYAWLNDELGLMGATVLKNHPNDYIAIGMSSAKGSYSYIKNRFINDDHQFTDSLFTATLRANKPGSWNEALSTAATDDYFLDFSKLDGANRSEFEKPKTFRIMGYGKESETGKEYYDVVLPRLFDVLIFLQTTRATTPLFE